MAEIGLGMASDAGPAAGPTGLASNDAGAVRAEPTQGGVAGALSVHLRFLEALARRTQAHRGSVRRRLDARLAVLRARLAEGHAEPRAEAGRAGAMAPWPDARPPGAAADVTLAGLVVRLAGSTGESAEPTGAPARRAELKSLRAFGDTWARLSAERQLASALARAPRNAGPLNSQRLVLQALERTHELSPDYFRRFMAHADALLRLERLAGADPGPTRGSERRARSGRARPR